MSLKTAVPIYWLGFDTAKLKLDYSLIDTQGHEQSYGTVANNERALMQLLLTITGHYSDVTITCVVESTSIYHYALVAACHALAIPCIVYNAILTRQQINSSVRGKKTDRSDATLIARVGWSGGGRLHVPEPYLATKHYGRAIRKLSNFNTSFKQYRAHLSSLVEFTADEPVQQALDDIARSITAAKQRLAVALAASAQSETFRLLQTIPGIGPYVAASLIGEIQDITRFPSARQLVAYAGLDAKIKQSGTALNNTGRLTKRGSSYLRHSLFIGANIARQYDVQFRATYDRKRTEGRSHKEATIVVARQLLKVVRSVWLNGKPYALPQDVVD